MLNNIVKRWTRNSKTDPPATRPIPDVVYFEGKALQLNLDWVHEREYAEFLTNATITGPLGMDVWVFCELMQKGDTVLDAGANIGFTSLLAQWAGAKKIHSFEPDPRLVNQVVENTQPSEKIEFHSIALGANPGELELRISQSHNQGSTFSDTHLKLFPQVYENSTTMTVAVESIDRFFPQTHFDFLKIDVEGAELDVVQGGISLFEHRPPRMVYVELYDEYFSPVNEFLKPFYRNVARVVCQKDGSGKLFPLDADFQKMTEQGWLAQPPSYIYSNQSLENWMMNWKRPRLIEKIEQSRNAG